MKKSYEYKPNKTIALIEAKETYTAGSIPSFAIPYSWKGGEKSEFATNLKTEFDLI